MTAKVIVRLAGGLGNQMFAYAAARRLALVSDAELVLDTVSGFARDATYARIYQLGAFNVAGREATPGERFGRFERVRRGALRKVSALLPYQGRPYIAQQFGGFDARLLARRVRGTVTLEGVWAGDGYFRDHADVIRADLRLKREPQDAANRAVAARIAATTAVGLHVRWFEGPGTASNLNVSPDYYRRAIESMRARLPDPHFFVFSDNPRAARANLPLSDADMTFVTHNDLEGGAVLDLWLLSQCRHFIIANSTFSWWAAWLGGEDGVVVSPDPRVVKGGSWDLKGFLPERWIKLPG